MKIGVLTYHRAINNGAVLQAYALTRTLNDLGVKSEIVDYTSKFIKNSYKIAPLLKRKSLKGILVFFLSDVKKIATLKKFSEFSKNFLPISNRNYDDCIQRANMDYEQFIVGSDQVWNLSVNGNDYNYFLEFADNGKKNSYAASFGKKDIPIDQQKRISNCLANYNFISVRETDGLEIVKELAGRNAVCRIDPVFLVEKNEWVETFGLTKRNVKIAYIFVFMLHDSELLLNKAKEYAAKKHLKLFMFSNDVRNPKGFKIISKYGPLDFLNMIKNAECVFTDSFHALAFSIIFNKRFFIGLKQGSLSCLNSRILSITEKFGIDNRILTDDNTNFDAEINYSTIEHVIDTEKDNSLSYLKKIIVEEKR